MSPQNPGLNAFSCAAFPSQNYHFEGLFSTETKGLDVAPLLSSDDPHVSPHSKRTLAFYVSQRCGLHGIIKQRKIVLYKLP